MPFSETLRMHPMSARHSLFIVGSSLDQGTVKTAICGKSVLALAHGEEPVSGSVLLLARCLGGCAPTGTRRLDEQPLSRTLLDRTT
jgi:hypothetical protein